MDGETLRRPSPSSWLKQHKVRSPLETADSIGIMLDSVKDVIWGAIRMIPISELNAPYHYIGMAYKSGLPYSDEVRSLIDHIIKISNRLDYEEPLEREFYS